MSTKKTIFLVYKGSFNVEKQAILFKNLRHKKFSGELILSDSQKKNWSFYLHQGDILYATGGIHPARRWHRNLTVHCPQMLSHIPVKQSEFSAIDSTQLTSCWEYHLLCLWLEQQKITNTQATKIIHAVVLEVLLEVALALNVTYQIHAINMLSVPGASINSEQAVAEFQQLWTFWKSADISDYSPNFAPTIKQKKQLSEQTSDQVYQTLTTLLNGQNTLYDLAVKMNRNIVQITRSLAPFIQAGWVELINISDLSTSVYRGVPKTLSLLTEPPRPLIACVDDDIWVCKSLERVLTTAGYQFVGVSDPMRAIAILISRKPELIFLDLVMPNTSGYEICSKLRKLPFFKNTPIVILTGNDGVVDQVRAKLFGASDFVSKPVDAEKVLKTVQKNLTQGAINR